MQRRVLGLRFEHNELEGFRKGYMLSITYPTIGDEACAIACTAKECATIDESSRCTNP